MQVIVQCWALREGQGPLPGVLGLHLLTADPGLAGVTGYD